MTPPPAKGARRLTRLALLTAIALTIFLVEAQLPALTAVPGIKLGLANIVTVYAVFTMGPGDALLILCARVFLGAVFWFLLHRCKRNSPAGEIPFSNFGSIRGYGGPMRTSAPTKKP